MRVLHLVNGLRIGGKERVALELCRLGQAQGHADGLLLYQHPRTGGPEELLAVDVPVHSLSPTHSRIQRVRKLARLVRELDPQVLHAHNDSALFLSSLALGRREHRIQRLVTLHNLPVGLGTRHRLAIRALARRQDRIVCVSDELRTARIARGWIRNAEVIPNGVDTERFQPLGPALDLRTELGVEHGALIVGMLARFDTGKRQLDLIAAASRIHAQGIPIAVVFAGDGPAKATTLAQVPRALPVLSRSAVADVPAFLRGLDAVALLSDHEGLPMSVLEAMACGLPVIASRVGGIPQLLGEPSAGLQVTHEPAALDAALLQLTRPGDRTRLGAAARERVLAEFALPACASRYYDEQANRPSSPTAGTSKADHR